MSHKFTKLFESLADFKIRDLKLHEEVLCFCIGDMTMAGRTYQITKDYHDKFMVHTELPDGGLDVPFEKSMSMLDSDGGGIPMRFLEQEELFHCKLADNYYDLSLAISKEYKVWAPKNGISLDG